MNSRSLLNIARKNTSILENSLEMYNYLLRVANFHEQFVQILENVDQLKPHPPEEARNGINTLKGEINEIFRSSLDAIRSLRPDEFYPLMSTFTSNLKEFRMTADSIPLRHMISDLDTLIRNHTDAYSEKDFPNVNRFVFRCYKISTGFLFFDTFAELVQRLYGEANELPDDYQSFDIYTASTEREVSDFLSALLSLFYLYKNICTVLDINPEEYPLLITKIESGSKWFKLNGKKAAILIIVALISEAAGVFKEYLNGSIRKEEIQNRVEQSKSIVELYGKAKDAKLDEESMAMLKFVVNRSIYEIYEGASEVQLNENVLIRFSEKDNLPLVAPPAILTDPKSQNRSQE